MTGIDWFRHFDEYEVLPDGEVVVHGNNYKDSIEVAPGEFKPSTHYIIVKDLPKTDESAHNLFEDLDILLRIELDKLLQQSVEVDHPIHRPKLRGEIHNVLRALERLHEVILNDQAEVQTSRMTRSPYRTLFIRSRAWWMRKLYVLMFDEDFMAKVKGIERLNKVKFWSYVE